MLGFRDRVRVSVRVSLGLGLQLRFGSVLDSPPSYSLYGFLCPLGLGLVYGLGIRLGLVLGFMDRVRVKVRVSFRIVTFEIYCLGKCNKITITI